MVVRREIRYTEYGASTWRSTCDSGDQMTRRLGFSKWFHSSLEHLDLFSGNDSKSELWSSPMSLSKAFQEDWVSAYTHLCSLSITSSNVSVIKHCSGYIGISGRVSLNVSRRTRHWSSKKNRLAHSQRLHLLPFFELHLLQQRDDWFSGQNLHLFNFVDGDTWI